MAVIMGGMSSEREISLRSGRAVAGALRKLGHEVREVDLGEDAVIRLHQLKGWADVAFICLHGRWGEDGTVQGALELLGIPYTGSGVLASSLAMSKSTAKELLAAKGLPVPRGITLDLTRTGPGKWEAVADEVERSLGYPCIVKPDREGSTLGTVVADGRDGLIRGLEEAFGYDERVMVEEFIRGRELTVGVLGDPPRPLPVLEVIPSHPIYDYQCKYTSGKTRYLVPAPLREGTANRLQELALRAHQVLGCEGISRVDFMLDGEENAYCLEVNTIPGMTELSLVPKAAEAAGMSFEDVVAELLSTARLKIPRRRMA
ncbi:MAG: D-alanine--D-alanine ligase [Candidatus Geothermincolales bacterium]